MDKEKQGLFERLDFPFSPRRFQASVNFNKVANDKFIKKTMQKNTYHEIRATLSVEVSALKKILIAAYLGGDFIKIDLNNA